MDVRLNEDQVMLQDITRRFLKDRSPIGALRKQADTGSGFDRDLWREAAELGWVALFVPEEFGGIAESAQGVVDAAVVAEELGRVVFSGPFLSTCVVAFAIARSGLPGQCESWLPRLATGEALAAWCFAGKGPKAGSEAGSIRVRVSRNDFVIDGHAVFVEDGGSADILLVTARHENGGLAQFLVPPDAAGVIIAPMEALDLGKRLAQVRFEGVRISADALLGDAETVAEAFERQLQVALVLQCAETVGVIDRVFEFTLEWVNDRHAFGRPIGSFQALKHRLADHAAQLEGAKAAAAHAARSVQASAPDAAIAVSIAKSQCGRNATTIIRDCLQMHGGIGLTWEHDIHFYLRRAVSNEALWGSPATHHERLCRLAGMSERTMPDTTGKITSTRTSSEDRDTEEQRAFRLKARDYMARHLPPRVSGEPANAFEDIPLVERDREIQRRLYDGGLGGYCGITVPREYGGLGLDRRFETIFYEEAEPYRLPWHYGNATNIVLPCLLAHGTEAQKSRYIPKILNGEHMWCQLLSEPSGGSDLAGVLTRAERRGDSWFLNGSKVWTSGGHVSDMGLCLARTDPTVRKHAGLTMFLVDMHSPGMTISQIRLVGGRADFCQEFLDDVEVPDEDRLGEVNDGWSVARTQLNAERAGIAAGWMHGLLRAAVREHLELSPAYMRRAEALGLADDPFARQLIGEAFVLEAIYDLTLKRVSAGMRSGALPGSAGTIPSLVAARTSTERTRLMSALAGPAGVATSPDEFGPIIGMDRVTTHRIGGGTLEMQLNLVAERHLGLPREPGIDREVPFNQLRHNKTGKLA